MKVHIKPSFLLYFIVLIVGAAIFSHSALLSDDGSQMHIDSQVYVYAAKQILEGKILYRELFDHKGPMMYIPECIGLALSGKNFSGLWFTQLIFFVAGVSPLIIFWAKKYHLSVALLALFFMSTWIFRTKTIGDNLPEIYAVPFICLLIFLCLKMNEEEKINRLFASMAGICGTGLFLIKPNLFIVVLPCLCWLCISFYRQEKLFPFLTYALFGCMIILMPLLIYFVSHHALKDALFAFWTFNFSYISDQKLSATASIKEVFLNRVNYLLIFILTASVLKFIFYKNETPVFMLLMISIIVSVLVLIGIPGRGAESAHYAIPLAPLIAWFVIYICKGFNRFQTGILFCIALYFCKPVFIHLFSYNEQTRIVNESVQYIKQHKRPGETLSVLGNHSSFYWQTGLSCNTPYFFTYPIIQNCQSEITRKFNEAFKKNKADWVVYETGYRFDTCITQILDGYKLIMTTKNEQIFHLE